MTLKIHTSSNTLKIQFRYMDMRFGIEKNIYTLIKNLDHIKSSKNI